MTDETRTLGERLNNPGNIRHGPPWNGLAEDQWHSEYSAFKSPQYGIRAIVRVLMTYQRPPPKGHGLKTLREMISRYAPHRGTHSDGEQYENPTEAYIANVSQWAGLDPDEPVDLKNRCVVLAIVRGIIRQENGRVDYEHRTIAEGVDMALEK